MEAAEFRKEPAHTRLTILDRLPKKEKNTLKVTILTSCMNFRMIQAVIKMISAQHSSNNAKIKLPEKPGSMLLF